MTRRWLLIPTSVLAVAAVLASCSSSTNLETTPTTSPEIASSTTIAATPVSSTVASTVPASTTSTPPSTAAITPTPPPPGSTGFELRSDGLGALDFGTPAPAVVTEVTSALGAPSSDETVAFPVASGEIYESPDSMQGFVHPAGRAVCWNVVGFCAYFGGPDASTLGLVGWRYDTTGEPTSIALYNVDGITVGSRWSEFLDAMTAEPGGCYTVGYGTAVDGISLTLQGGDFSTLDTTGQYVEAVPQPSDVTVIGMSSGDEIFGLDEGDC